MKLIKMTWLFTIGILFLGASTFASASELEPGTVINAQNFDKLKGETFEGKTIGSMVPEKMELMIRKWGLTIKLRHSEEYPQNPQYIEATKKYAGFVKYDPKTRKVTGYQAGDPFPNLSEKDPDIAAKVIWRYYYGVPFGDVLDYQNFNYVLIDGNKGLERTQRWYFLRVYLKRRLLSDTPVSGDGSILQKTLLTAQYPRDIRGLGTYSVRYDDGRFEDQWAYIKSVRRTRRLPGGAWMDSPGGNDQLADDVGIFNAYPTWYAKYNFLGKRTILAVAHAKSSWRPDKEGTPEEYPTIDLTHPPYWNPVAEWEPREVYVVEAITFPEHPYSKKVIYFDAGYSTVPYMADVYDRKGDFWKFFVFNYSPLSDERGNKGYVAIVQGAHIDIQRRHATDWVSKPKINTKGITEANVTLGELEKRGR